MAVELPPPLPPQQSSVAEIRSAQAGGAEVTVPFQNYTVHVLGNQGLDKDQIAAAVAHADSLSNAVRALTATYYAAGYPGVELRYALADNDLYVLAQFAKIAGVKAPDELEDYFENLQGETLTSGLLEPDRVLASSHAEFEGEHFVSGLTPAGAPGEYNYEVERTDDAKDPAQVRIEVGNPGNRFVGRNFGQIELRYGFETGDQLRALYMDNFSGLNKKNGSGDYTEQQLGWVHVTPWGLFGINGRYAYYNPASNTQIDASILDGGISYSGILMADFDNRWTIEGRVDRTDKTAEQGGTTNNPRLQSQVYTSAEIGTDYSWIHEAPGAARWEVEWALAVRKGLTNGDAFSLDDPDLNYLLFRPSAHLRVTPYDLASLRFGVDVLSQFSSNVLPEEQQFVLGGVNNLYAYLPGVAVGDSGYYARVQTEFLGLDFNSVSLIPKAFFEYGASEFNKDRSSPTSAGGVGDSTQDAMDVGGEVTAKFLDFIEASASAAYPVTHNEIDTEASAAHYFIRVAVTF